MSMIGHFGLLSQAEIDSLLASPETIVDVIAPEDGNIYEDERFYCVEKDWHGIHFLLNGKPWTGEPPLDFIVAGGTDVGDIDVGYGPARVFTPSDLTRIVSALRPLNDVVLRSHFTAEAFAAAGDTIYPGFGHEHVEYVIGAYRGLQQFLESAAKKQLGLLVWCD